MLSAIVQLQKFPVHMWGLASGNRQICFPDDGFLILLACMAAELPGKAELSCGPTLEGEGA